MSKIKPIISINLLNNYLDGINIFSDNERRLFNSIFAEADQYDLDGNKIEGEDLYYDGYKIPNGDNILNDNEQVNFLNMLKEKCPKIFSRINNFFAMQKSMSEYNILANNIAAIDDNPKLLKYSLENLNNQNFTEIAKIYNHNNIDSFFYTLYNNAQMCEHEESGITEIVMQKFKSYAEYMLNTAKQNNIYCNDYEKEIETFLECKNYENYVYTLDNLQSRIIIETDYNNTLDATKRKLECKEPNGKIDENFAQGYTGDCWFLSAILSITNNTKLLDYVNNMIEVEKENNTIKTVKVNIQGNEYKIDYEELKNANEYSSGDLDVRALEIAINRYMHEYERGDINRPCSPELAYQFLFGEENVEFKDDYDADEYINVLKQNNANIQSTLATGNTKVNAYNKKGDFIQLSPNHALTYTHIEGEYIYFKDPQNEEFHIPIKDLPNTFDSFNTSIIHNI